MAQKTRPCILCNAPLDREGNCSTPGCAYNPVDEGKEFDKEHEFDENMHQGGSGEELEDMPYEGGGDGGNLPDTEGLEGDFEDFDPSDTGDAEEDLDRDRKGDESGDDGDLDISQEDLPEPDAPDDMKGAPPEDDYGDDPDAEGEGDLDEMTPEQKDKLNEQGDQEPTDEAEDEDSDLPPRPQGCSGNCQPGEVGEDGDPCPHCTAKSFKEEMRDQGKEHLPEEEMEKEMQNFLDDWMNQKPEQGDEPEPAPEDPPEKQERDQRLEERTPPDLMDEDDNDLPPRPNGCNGDCQPSDQFDPEADPCPHCTAKQFKEQMRHDNDDEKLEEMDSEQLGDMFQDFLKDWAEKQDKAEEEPEQKNPDEIDEDPPEEELNDGPPEEESEQKPDEEPEEKKIEREDEDNEFKRKAKDMTVTQEKRFDNIVDRLTKKVEQTFGQTAEDIYVMAKSDGQFQGEEVSQSIQITSRGVTYWVTLSAAKEI